MNFWTKPRVEQLCVLWSEGLRTIVIAKRIGDGCTRNMVIGKAYRIGLPKRSDRELGALISEGRQEFWNTKMGHIRRAEAAARWRDPVWREAVVEAMVVGHETKRRRRVAA